MSEVRITLRLPEHVHASIEADAKKHNRSLNGEIIQRLSRSTDSGVQLDRIEAMLARALQKRPSSTTGEIK